MPEGEGLESFGLRLVLAEFPGEGGEEFGGEAGGAGDGEGDMSFFCSCWPLDVALQIGTLVEEDLFDVRPAAVVQGFAG